jgi:hypothetical protein
MNWLKHLRFLFTKWRIDRAQALLNKHGLVVVRVVVRAGTTYLVKSDGSFARLEAGVPKPAPVKKGKK